jgi:hypothetical protein
MQAGNILINCTTNVLYAKHTHSQLLSMASTDFY